MNAPVKNPPMTFAEAFVKLQGEIKPAIKDATNPAFRSKYADLGAVWEAVRGPLTDNGFGIIQAPQFEGEVMFLETILLHSGGERMTSRYPLRPSKQDPQGFGSAITYAKRYALSAMLGVVADEDDDGNAASGVGAKHGSTGGGKITSDQLTTLRELIATVGANIEGFCAHFKIEALPDLPAAKYGTAIEMLNIKGKTK